MKLIIFISFIFSIILDITLSEYPNYIHPVFYIGCVGKFFDKILKREKFKNKFLLVFLGFLSLILEIIIWLFLIIIFEYMLKITFFNSQIFIYYLIYSIFYIFILKSTFSIKALYNHVKNCDTENIEELRKNVSKIVSRNTSILNQNQLYSAALESLSENIHDSIIGPHFYFMLFGLKGAFIYRIISTYDALFGYRNEKYEYFGKTHARLDDFFNFIPARISCFIMFFFNPKSVIKYIKKYGRIKINSTLPMSAFAGILKLGFEKKDYYKFNGKLPQKEDINRGLKIFTKIAIIWISLIIIIQLIIILKNM